MFRIELKMLCVCVSHMDVPFCFSALMIDVSSSEIILTKILLLTMLENKSLLLFAPLT